MHNRFSNVTWQLMVIGRSFRLDKYVYCIFKFLHILKLGNLRRD